ncbi:MAG TPA: sensor histidine kinase [Thermoanaerobaculia bacterium]|nr:sensor histidine kinase [Thermoanaerobaculia bacterium]
MSNRRFPQSRAERLVAAGRLVLAGAAYGAIYFDPLGPARYVRLTYTLLAAYCAYALVLTLWTLASSTTTHRAQLATHWGDMVFFGAINYMTFGPTTPFFVFFVFSIICAMLRFGRRGTIITAAVAVAVFMASSAGHLSEAHFELNRFIIRVTYLFVLASMLIYLSDYQERIQDDLQRIARWPRSARRDLDSMVGELMAEAAAIFAAKRVILAYRHLSTRAAWMATMHNGTLLRCEKLPAEDVNLLLEQDEGTYFSSAAYPAARLDFDDSASIQRARRPADIEQRFGIQRMVATSFKGEFVRGRLLLLDGAPPLLEEVNLARIAGTVVAGRLDHHHAAQQLQRGAAAEERVRVGRDLHDSVLQSLTGVALQLRTLPKLMTHDRDTAESRLAEVEQVIASTQKELRWFIDELRPDRRTRDGEALGERLASLAQRFRDQWGLEVQNDVADVVHLLPAGLRYEVYAIVNEAVANAAKHASAKHVAVAVDVDDGEVSIDVADDGKGFPFHGRYDLPSLIAGQRGPVTLKERVSSCGGSMIIDSSDRGARLEVRIPLHGTGSAA